MLYLGLNSMDCGIKGCKVYELMLSGLPCFWFTSGFTYNPNERNCRENMMFVFRITFFYK